LDNNASTDQNKITKFIGFDSYKSSAQFKAFLSLSAEKADGNTYSINIDPKNFKGIAQVNQKIDIAATETSFDIVIKSNSGELKKHA